jgi:hypothetical protein
MDLIQFVLDQCGADLKYDRNEGICLLLWVEAVSQCGGRGDRCTSLSKLANRS